MTVFGFFESISELILFGLAPLILVAAAIWIIWYVLQKNDPVEVKDTRSFLTFILVVVPFVMLVGFGTAVAVYDELAESSGSPEMLPVEPLSPTFLGLAVFYIGQSVWLWSHWRKL